jgi:hypothetical protein
MGWVRLELIVLTTDSFVSLGEVLLLLHFTYTVLLLCKYRNIGISIELVDVWHDSLGESPKETVMNHSVIEYENVIWQHCILCNTYLVPAQFVPLVLPQKLLQPVLPCWLDSHDSHYLQLGENQFTSFSTLRNHLSPNVFSKFHFCWQSIT